MAKASERSLPARVTMAQVAELAEVSPSAASNWRRRFPDFPDAIGTSTGGREVFSLDDVEAWLLAHNRFSPGKHAVSVLWRVSDLLRDLFSSDELVDVVCSIIAFLHLEGQETSTPRRQWQQRSIRTEIQSIEDAVGKSGLLEPLRRVDPALLVDLFHMVSDVSPVDRPELFEDVLERQSRFVPTRSGEKLTQLLLRLAISSESSTVLDPAAGEGGFLIEAMRQARGARQLLHCFGQEIDDRAWRAASQRLLIHELDGDVRHGDSLSNDAFTGETFDVVLCDPPYGQLNPGIEIAPDPRWAFGLPPRKSGDFAWLQHALAHLSSEGRAYVVLPSGSLQRKGLEAEIRRAMLRRGAIEAIVALPAGAAEHTSIPLALWIVRQPDDDSSPSPVLLVDGVGVATKPRGIDSQLIDRVGQIVTRWRESQQVSASDSSVATAVAPLELLGRDGDLIPIRWISDVALGSGDVNAKREELLGSIRSISGSIGTQGLDSGALDAVVEQWVPIRTLLTQEIAEVIRGVRIKPEQCGASGTRAIRTKDIVEYGISEKDPCYVDLAELSTKVVVTQPGDILVSPGGGKPRAVVDDVGGNVLVSPVQALRIRREWLDPRVAAAFLASPRNRRFVVGSTAGFARLDLRDLELPVLTLEQTSRLRDALDRLSELETMGRALADSALQLKELVLQTGDQPKQTAPKGDG
jgi:hypothetical protein